MVEEIGQHRRGEWPGLNAGWKCGGLAADVELDAMSTGFLASQTRVPVDIKKTAWPVAFEGFHDRSAHPSIHPQSQSQGRVGERHSPWPDKGIVSLYLG